MTTFQPATTFSSFKIDSESITFSQIVITYYNSWAELKYRTCFDNSTKWPCTSRITCCYYKYLISNCNTFFSLKTILIVGKKNFWIHHYHTCLVSSVPFSIIFCSFIVYHLRKMRQKFHFVDHTKMIGRWWHDVFCIGCLICEWPWIQQIFYYNKYSCYVKSFSLKYHYFQELAWLLV